jgi:hypothetical protein
MEIVPHIRAEGTASARVGFRPQELGDHEILVSIVRNGERELLGAANLEVIETLPTPTVPPAPPSVFDEDDSCAISSPGRSSSKGALVLLLTPMLLVALRARPNRGRRRPNNRRP